MAKAESSLLKIAPAVIRPNPENPRMIFHETEMRELRESIRKVGIKVPISVYREKTQYVLLDGERRWRCARKLNLKTMPALVQPKPDPLENLLMMFNIHNVRVRWDLLPMAYKLKQIKGMLEKEEKSPSPQDLASITGLNVTTVKRALELLELPNKYQELLLEEIKKPRDKQKVKVDLFIEIRKALRSVERHVPEVFDKVSPNMFLDVMFYKYTKEIENNVVNFRMISKIARAHKSTPAKTSVAPILVRLVKDRKYSVQDAYDKSVRSAYEVTDLTAKTTNLIEALSSYRDATKLPIKLKRSLNQLRTEIERLLRSSR